MATRDVLFLIAAALVCSHRVNADFVETFSGTGPYASSGVALTGFDNPGWWLSGDGIFRDGGLWVENSPRLESDSDFLVRDEKWKTGFVSTVEIRDHTLTLIPDSDGEARIGFAQDIGSDRLSLFFSAIENSPDMYRARLVAGNSASEEDVTELIVDRGPHILMSIVFDEATSQATYRYDNNLDDNVPSIVLGTLDYPGTISEDATLLFSANKITGGQADALIDHWTFASSEPPIFPGDFNANGIFDAEDIDLLNAEIRSGSNNPDFDLVEDGVIDNLDRTFWVHMINNTFFGDANLDGEFNSGDLVVVFQAGQYEDGSAAGWAAGDWNGDARFTSNDLVVAFQDRGYETGPRAAATAVPESTSVWWLLLFSALLACGRQVRARFGSPC